MYNALSACECGKRHRAANRPKQDAFRLTRGEDFLYAGVADGHGGVPYARSGLGARIALAAGEAAVRQSLGQEDFATAVKDRFDHFVSMHLARRPPTESELEKLDGQPPEHLYGTTLLGSVIKWGEGKCRFFRIGDGDLNVVDENGRFLKIFPEDDDCVSGKTSSMVYEREACIGHLFVRDLPMLPAAILLNTDGYSFREMYPTQLVSSVFSEDPAAAFAETLRQGRRGDDQTALLLWQEASCAAPAFAEGLKIYREIDFLRERNAMLCEFLRRALERSTELRSAGREEQFLRLRKTVAQKLALLHAGEERIQALTALTCDGMPLAAAVGG